MTTELTTLNGQKWERWVIRMMDKSWIYISAATGRDLQQKSIQGTKTEKFTIGSATRSFAAVVFLGSESEYYDQYPEDRPEPKIDGMSWSDIKKLPGIGYDNLISKSPNHGLELMAKGLQKFIDSRKKQMDGISKSTKNAEELLKKMRLRYAKMNQNKQLA